MTDPLFREFLVTTAQSLRNSLTDPGLSVDDLMTTCQKISNIERRVARIDNPVTRAKRTQPTE